MAKYYSSTFGKISGKHGTAVAVIRKDGSTYLRLHVPSSNPRTEKQQAHRAKFALTSKSLVPFNPIFKETMGITNGISTARSHAFKNAIVGEYPNLEVNYEKIMFSLGSLEKLHNACHTRNEGVVTVSWDFTEMFNCHGDDSVSLVVFNKNTKQALHIKDIAERSDKEFKIDIYDSWADSDLYLWSYVTSDDKKSDSVFICTRDVELGKNDGVPLQGGGNEVCDSVDKAPYVYPKDDKHMASSVQSWISEFALSLIMMVYSIVTMITKAVTVTNVRNVVNALRHNINIVLEYVDNVHKDIVNKINLKPTRRRVFEVFNCKYHNIFSPLLIPILSHNARYVVKQKGTTLKPCPLLLNESCFAYLII